MTKSHSDFQKTSVRDTSWAIENTIRPCFLKRGKQRGLKVWSKSTIGIRKSEWHSKVGSLNDVPFSLLWSIIVLALCDFGFVN